MKSIKRNLGFTLAEILIVISIIGVVAAITLPTLIKNHQKKVYYTQFMKANSILQQAIKMYKYENETEELDGRLEELKGTFPNEFPKYVKVLQNINAGNYDYICNGYSKLPPAWAEKEERFIDTPLLLCEPDSILNNEGDYAYITIDGMLFRFYIDLDVMGENIVDINGPDKGPNIFGRDIFMFYLYNPFNNYEPGFLWAGTFDRQLNYIDACTTRRGGEYCAGRLIRDGKMNY